MLINELLLATGETLLMTMIAGLVAAGGGIPLGILLFISRELGIRANSILNRILSALINSLRSIPFIILLVAVIPLTRFLTGTSIGSSAAIVPLSIGAIPFMARLVEGALMELPIGLTEVGLTMGATVTQMVYRIYLPEALSGIINSFTTTLINLVGYTAMAGAIGGGGLGDLAIRYGYQRFDTLVMFATVVILIFIVQTIQFFGDLAVKKFG